MQSFPIITTERDTLQLEQQTNVMSTERPAGQLDDAGALRTGGVGAAEHGEEPHMAAAAAAAAEGRRETSWSATDWWRSNSGHGVGAPPILDTPQNKY